MWRDVERRHGTAGSLLLGGASIDTVHGGGGGQSHGVGLGDQVREVWERLGC